MTIIHEKVLAFEFKPPWQVVKYDAPDGFHLGRLKDRIASALQFLPVQVAVINAQTESPETNGWRYLCPPEL